MSARRNRVRRRYRRQAREAKENGQLSLYGRRLVSDAARAVELFGEDELERYAEEIRGKGRST